MKFNKSLHPDDYAHLSDFIQKVNHVKANANVTWHHKHRLWEYAQALRAVQTFLPDGGKVLEIGAGGSAMPCVLALAGYDVTVVDPDGEINKQAAFAKQFGVELELVQESFLDFDKRRTFDAVVCLSTIEHVEKDSTFLLKASAAAKSLLVVSTDFHPSGAPQTKWHLRAYNDLRLEAIVKDLKNWQLVDTPDWADTGPHVNGYNFATLVLEPAKKTSAKKKVQEPEEITA